MTVTLEVVALVASLVSVILASFAIWLSWKFFDKSTQDSRNIETATEKIGASVDKLQKVFDLFSNKHLDMIDKTQSALIKHAWTKETPSDKIEEKAEEKAAEKISLLKQSVDDELKLLIAKQTTTDGKLDFVQEHIEELVNRAIDKTREVEKEVREETLRAKIIKSLERTQQAEMRMWYLTELFDVKGHVPIQEIADELEKMESDNLISLSSGLTPNSIVTLIR
jgi:biopolymer transport protein ExbB/TolQ